MTVFIYGLRCPIAGQIRYIGKSIHPEARLRAHVTDAISGKYNHHAARWLRKLAALKLSPDLVILEEVQEGDEWQAVEQRWIACALDQGWPLTNSTDGGDGAENPSPETVAARSLAMMAHWERKEYRDLITAYRNDPEFLVAQSDRLKARWQAPEHRKKMQESRWTEEKRAEQAERIREPDRVVKIVSRRNDLDVKERQRAAMKANWAKRKAEDPDGVAKMVERIKAANNSPETKARAIAKRKETMARPEIKQKKADSLRAMWARRKAAKDASD